MDAYYVLGLYAVAFVIIWVLALLFKDKLKIDVSGPLLMRRTTRLRDFIDAIAQKSPRFWKVYMTIGIPVAVFFMAFMIYAIFLSLQMLFQVPTAALVLPGVDVPGSPIFIPLGYGLIALATVLVIHEFSHGILARAEGIKIKSIGLLMFAVIPGAFVEPDEEEVEKASRLAKLRIYTAGSISNLTLAGIAIAIFWLLSSFFIPATFHSDGVLINSITPNSPAQGILKDGMVIHSINGYPINDKNDYSTVLFNKTKPGDSLTYITDQGTFTIKSTGQPSNASITYAGTRSDTNYAVNSDISKIYGSILPWIPYYLTDLLWWVFLLNFLVGTFNLLPMKPLDGGLIFEELLRYRLSERNAKVISSNLSYVFIVIVGLMLIYGVVPGIMRMF